MTQEWQLDELEKAWRAAHADRLLAEHRNAIEEGIVAANYELSELKAELAALKSPWVYIRHDDNGPVAETLPPEKTPVFLSFEIEGLGVVYPGYRVRHLYRYFLTDNIIGKTPYAWQPWPTPAPITP